MGRVEPSGAAVGRVAGATNRSPIVVTGVRILLGLAVLVAILSGPAFSQGTSPLNESEQELLRVDGHVLTVQRALSAARKRGDDPEKVRKLQKKFDKLQKKRVGLLRETWQM